MQADISGKKYGRLVAVKFIERRGHRGENYYWLFRCECGKKRITSKSSVVTGRHSSCGCLQKEVVGKVIRERNTTHGMTKTRFYHIWQSIKRRCLYSRADNYKFYGGRGITLVKRWLKFENFKNDMFDSYLAHVRKFGENETSIDRVNVNGNYGVGNCRWATWKEQANNKRPKELMGI